MQKPGPHLQYLDHHGEIVSQGPGEDHFDQPELRDLTGGRFAVTRWFLEPLRHLNLPRPAETSASDHKRIGEVRSVLWGGEGFMYCVPPRF